MYREDKILTPFKSMAVLQLTSMEPGLHPERVIAISPIYKMLSAITAQYIILTWND